jgi:hypothetical protein
LTDLEISEAGYLPQKSRVGSFALRTGIGIADAFRVCVVTAGGTGLNTEVQYMTSYSARCAFLRSYQILSILTHYPRLIRAMRGTALLSGMEAAICIRDLKAGRRWSVEAVNAYGGTRKVLVDAWKYRRFHVR